MMVSNALAMVTRSSAWLNQPMKLYVEDKVHYLVQPGLYKDKMAVQVLQYVEEDVEI